MRALIPSQGHHPYDLITRQRSTFKYRHLRGHRISASEFWGETNIQTIASTYYVPGTLLDTEDMTVNYKKLSLFLEIAFQWQRFMSSPLCSAPAPLLYRLQPCLSCQDCCLALPSLSLVPTTSLSSLSPVARLHLLLYLSTLVWLQELSLLSAAFLGSAACRMWALVPLPFLAG